MKICSIASLFLTLGLAHPVNMSVSHLQTVGHTCFTTPVCLTFLTSCYSTKYQGVSVFTTLLFIVFCLMFKYQVPTSVWFSPIEATCVLQFQTEKIVSRELKIVLLIKSRGQHTLWILEDLSFGSARQMFAAVNLIRVWDLIQEGTSDLVAGILKYSCLACSSFWVISSSHSYH